MRPGQICQLSYIIQNKENTVAKNFFFAVDYVEFGAMMVHGFSVEKLQILSGGKKFSDCFLEIKNDFSCADLIASHNTAFDFSFMRAEYERLNEIFCIKNDFCTMKKSTPILKLSRNNSAGYKYPKLSELCSFFGISEFDIISETKRLFNTKTGFHDARFDTTAVYLASKSGMEKENAFKELKKFL